MKSVDREFFVPGVGKIKFRDTFGEVVSEKQVVKLPKKQDGLKDAMNKAALASGLGPKFFK